MPRGGGAVLRHARHIRRERRIDLRRAGGSLHHGWNRAENLRILPQLGVSRALRIQGPVSQLSRSHSDLRRDAQVAGAAGPEDIVQNRFHERGEGTMNATMTRGTFVRALAATLLSAGSARAAAPGVAEFYRVRTVTLI